MKIDAIKLLDARSSSWDDAQEIIIERTIDDVINPDLFAVEHLRGLKHFSATKARNLNLGLEFIEFTYPYTQRIIDGIGESHTFYSIACGFERISDRRYKFTFGEKTDISQLSGTIKEYGEKNLPKQLLQLLQEVGA